MKKAKTKGVRIWCLLLVLLVLLMLLSGCGEDGNAGRYPDADPSQNEGVQVDVPAELASYVVPWQTDVPEQALSDGTMHFYFMTDGGMTGDKWGDCCLVILPDGKAMLIDGGVQAYAPLLLQNLQCLGVERIDYLIISHGHSDHVGAIYSDGGLLDHVEVGQAYYNGVYPAYWKDVHVLEKKLDEKGVSHQSLSQGDVLTLGEVMLEVLWPYSREVGAAYGTDEELNNTSMVFRLDYGETSALFTGDIYVQTEQALVSQYADKLDVDLLKIPHHGQRTSSCAEFAGAVTPSVAVATGYQAVATDIYANYTQTGSRVYLDICDGYVHVTSDGENLTVQTSKERTTDHYAAFEYQG